MKVRIHRICKDNPLPTQANPNDAGYDVFAADACIIDKGEVVPVPLGIIAEASKGYHFKLIARSSLQKKGFRLANSVGIIDSSFCGKSDEMKVLIEFVGYGKNVKNDATFGYIEPGERIAQLILEKNNEIEWDEQEDVNFAGKSRGGFGSSGK